MTEIVDIARGWIGTPYLHQASVKGAGCDCLGLIRGVWRSHLGAEPEVPPAYSYDWSEATGKEILWQAALRNLCPVSAEDARVGDVLLFRMTETAVAKHLGILSRPAPAPHFIHAYSGHGVVETALGSAWARRIVARFRFPERFTV